MTLGQKRPTRSVGDFCIPLAQGRDRLGGDLAGRGGGCRVPHVEDTVVLAKAGLARLSPYPSLPQPQFPWPTCSGVGQPGLFTSTPGVEKGGYSRQEPTPRLQVPDLQSPAKAETGGLVANNAAGRCGATRRLGRWRPRALSAAGGLGGAG